ncbi:Pr6Pr family membrane protein [Pedobacter sp. MC2016-14]|uniref:Pr6Pr family membrane protein n=1 Tax=Pedobacter sp. MC2016-14 TaxID=2897327 RepID=UPI001E46AB33|nr:Pr6Pr family membrane protein [Pedobacter sp. MC2016-14]MCD0489129.1 Pr6Pr family membrane protein [Pedobacter sp. MC2016-14]
MMKTSLKSLYATIYALVLWFALILQFYISTRLYLDKDRTFAGAVLQIISYFTIETNLLIAIAITTILLKPGSSWGKFFAKSTTQTAIAVYILIVGLIYVVLLKGLWQLDGLFKLTDFLLHTFSPIAYLLYWIFFVSKETIAWKNLLSWAVFPLLYLFYSLIRGAISGYYPYPFVNAAKFGYLQVMLNSLGILLVFIIFSAALIVTARLLKK